MLPIPHPGPLTQFMDSDRPRAHGEPPWREWEASTSTPYELAEIRAGQSGNNTKLLQLYQTIQQMIAARSGETASLTNRVNSIEARGQQAKTTSDAQSNQVSAKQQTLEDLARRLDDLATQIGVVQEDVAQQKAASVLLRERKAALEIRLAEKGSQLDQLSLNQQVASKTEQQAHATLKERLNTVEDGIKELENEHQTTSEQIHSFEKDQKTAAEKELANRQKLERQIKEN